MSLGLAAGLALAGAGTATAQTHSCPTPLNLTCGFLSCRAPAHGVPSALWGDIRPVDTGQLPANRDNSALEAAATQSPHWTSLDIENGYIFAASNWGFQVWNANSSPADPTRLAAVGPAQFPQWVLDPHEGHPVRDIDAPPGNDDVVAMTVFSEGGLAIFNTSTKSLPQSRYGDINKNAIQVYAGRVNGVDYSFTATRDAGLLVHNMTVVQNLPSLCTDDTPALNTCGVYVGRLGTRGTVSYVDGVGNPSGTALWVAASSGGFGFGLEIWDVSNPSSPQLEISGLAGDFVHGVALWRRGSSYYLGTRVFVDNSNAQARIYDVSCIATGTCGGNLGAPVWTRNLPNPTGEYFVTYSSGGAGRDYLYYGSVNRCNNTTQGEWLFDVTSPSQAHDITPPDGFIQVLGQPTLTGYWGWYYRRNPTGYNEVQPRMGKFNGQYFYRAAFSIFDIHQLTGGLPPNASFTYTSPVYEGVPETFTDTSSGAPTSWSWTFQDATPGTSSQQNPTVTFNSTGTKQVSLMVTNGVGSDSTSQSVTVLDPAPQVSGVTASPSPALQCQSIDFTAQNVSGFPDPGLSWEIRASDDTVVTTCGDVNPCVWSTDGNTAPDLYTAEVTATNTAGTATASTTVTVDPLPSLPGGGSFFPTNDPFAAGTVQFHVSVAGATEWNWDFGDGSSTGWIDDPVAGPNPVHTYTAVGSYDVTVQVRNCVEGARTSGVLTVDVLQIAPLVAHFAAQGCGGFGCFFDTGVPISFDHSGTEGSPTGWEYDWNHTGGNEADCTFSGSPGLSPVTSHTYTTQGTYQPCLRVSRSGGAETDVYVHSPALIISSGGGTPSITISGPTSGQVNQALSFGATAQNCTPTPGGWSWTASGGGVISEPSTSNQVTITWSSTGSKSVTASNGGCTGASDNHTVVISDGGGGGGGDLNANFTFSPQNPETDQQVSFNGSSSTGSPDGYSWDFGDGGTATGVTATHTYGEAGSYQVTLEVSKFDPEACPPFGACSDTQTRTVVVTQGGPPPLTADFQADAACTGNLCFTTAGEQVTLTSLAPDDADSYEWDFGDGADGTGQEVTHTWNTPGEYTVVHVVRRDGEVATRARLFDVEPGESFDSVVVLPWIADTTGALEQSSGLFVTNPTGEPMEVVVTFRKRGLPENPPPATDPIPVAPHQTLYYADVLDELFGRNDTGGFLILTAEDVSADPVVTSLNQTRQPGGIVFGQMVPGISMQELDAAADAGGGRQYLLGLTDTDERHTYFGVTNPHPEPAVYTLTFYDHLGELVAGPSEEQTVSAWGQKQFQIQELRDLFGVEGREDYRVEIDQVSGGTLFPYAGVVRQGTQDQAFVRVSVPNLARIYLVGAASTPGFNQAFFQTDAVLSNPTEQVLTVDVTYRNVGLNSEPEETRTLTLQPEETVRVRDVLFDRWGIEGGAGVLTFESVGSEGEFPMIHGETYQNSGPGTQFGLFMPARRDGEAAVSGQRVVFTGLRQHDDEANTTLWLFNPSDEVGSYDLTYYGLDGSALGVVEDYRVGAGGIRQINPGRHPLPEGGVEGGFSLEISVRQGQLIAGAQVVINVSNDPAYVVGAVR